MGWTTSWYLEKRYAQDVWRFLPDATRLMLSYDNPDGLDSDDFHSFLHDLEYFCINHWTTSGFPSCASPEVTYEADKWVNHSLEEIATFPLFGWISVQAILDADWSQAFVNPSKQCPKWWRLWQERLRSFGDPRQLRFVYISIR